VEHQGAQVSSQLKPAIDRIASTTGEVNGKAPKHTDEQPYSIIYKKHELKFCLTFRDINIICGGHCFAEEYV
jgi:hypothetical protein